jgi:hypothetical protein
MKIVTLGMCCRVSNTLKALNLKAESSLFEWMRSEKFSDVLYIIGKVVRGEHVPITKRSGFADDFLDDTDIRTIHYLGSFETVFKRRSERFADMIRSDEPLLFIREEKSHISEAQINSFIEYIQSVNDNCKFKFLLFSETDDFIPIELPNLFHYALPKDNNQYETFVKSLINEK